MTWSELHCHSACSFMDGASRPQALAARAAELGYRALALTDHDNLAGIVAHARACAAVGIRPIAGVEVTLVDGSHLTLLARDAAGYRSLAEVVSHAHLAGSKGAPRLALADLARYAVGLECLSGCRQGQAPRALLAGDERSAHAALTALCDMFGRGHVWVELQRGGLPDDNRLCYGLARLARATGLPLVATGNSHYADPMDRDLQDVLVCIRHRVPITQARPFLRSGSSWRLPAPAEMARRCADYPSALRGAVELAARCGFELAHVDAMFPAFPVPAGHTARSYLRQLTLAGARERYGTPLPEAVTARLEHELSVIAGLGRADYILVVWDLVRYARERGILCQGRGSSVGSAVCYCLGITSVEPLTHGLSFERFLSPGRIDPPDIDVDLPADRSAHSVARESVIQYALRRWNGHAALVANTVTYRSRSAVREVGMALGLNRAQLDLLARESGDLLAPDAAPPDDVLRRLALPGSAVLQRLHDLCARIEGLPRHLSQHPGGIVVTARPLAQVAPVEHARDLPAARDEGKVLLLPGKALSLTDDLGRYTINAHAVCVHLRGECREEQIIVRPQYGTYPRRSWHAADSSRCGLIRYMRTRARRPKSHCLLLHMIRKRCMLIGLPSALIFRLPSPNMDSKSCLVGARTLHVSKRVYRVYIDAPSSAAG